jgi:hypothetical protein
MSQIPVSKTMPSHVSHVGITGAGSIEFVFSFADDIFSTLEDQAIIRKPREAEKGTVEEFKTTLHDIVPELRNLEDEDIQGLIDERNTDISDDM